MRRVRERALEIADYCDAEVLLAVVGGKWKLVILHHLLRGTHRFCALRRELPPITQRMLTRALRELEEDGLVRRTVYPEVPPKVEYDLTELGHSLRPIIEQMTAWGGWYRERLRAAGPEPEPEALPQRTSMRSGASPSTPNRAGAPSNMPSRVRTSTS